MEGVKRQHLERSTFKGLLARVAKATHPFIAHSSLLAGIWKPKDLSLFQPSPCESQNGWQTTRAKYLFRWQSLWLFMSIPHLETHSNKISSTFKSPVKSNSPHSQCFTRSFSALWGSSSPLLVPKSLSPPFYSQTTLLGFPASQPTALQRS